MRFRGVSNVRALERQLDNIIIGSLKLYVNIPRYDRGRRNYAHRIMEHGTQTNVRRQRMTAPPQIHAQHWKATMTYAQALRSNRAKSRPKQYSHDVGAGRYGSLMRILKLAKYRLKAQVEKDEGPSGEG